MKKGKTIREWINDLPQPYRDMALEHAKDHAIKHYLNIEQPTARDGLMAAFDWPETKEGSKFWSMVSMGRYEDAGKFIAPRKRPSFLLRLSRRIKRFWNEY
jgi:hypothetical protein